AAVWVPSRVVGAVRVKIVQRLDLAANGTDTAVGRHGRDPNRFVRLRVAFGDDAPVMSVTPVAAFHRAVASVNGAVAGSARGSSYDGLVYHQVAGLSPALVVGGAPSPR